MSDTASKSELPGLVLPFGQTVGEAAFQAWSGTVASVYDLDVAREDLTDFKFGFSAWHFGSLILGASQSEAIRFWRSPQTIARSGIDHYLVQVYEEGGFRSHVEGRDMMIEPGDVWIVDLSRTVRNDQAKFRSTNLAIPRSVLAPLLPDPDALHGLKLSRNSPTGGLLSRYLSDLSVKARQMTPEEANSVAQSTVHLIAGCAGPSIDAAELARDGLSFALLSRIKAGIERDLANPDMGPEHLCKVFAVSRATLYRLFKPYDGVNAYIRQRRLARCFHEIAAAKNASQRISAIAAKWGFINETSFSRVFRQAFGISPSDARDATRRYATLGNGGNRRESELSQWLRQLMKL